MGAKETGQAFLAEVLAHVPEDRRAAVQEALTGSEQALTTLGAGVLRQSDYSRQMDTVAQAKRDADATMAQANVFKGELDGWFEEHKAELEEYARMKGNPNPPADKPAITGGGGITAEQLAEEFAKREAGYAGAMVNIQGLTLKHFQTFSEVLDVPTLMKDPQIRELGLDGVYQKVHGPRLAEKAKAAEDARIEAEVTKRTNERLAQNPRFPYPTSPREPSPLDRLENPPKPGETPTPIGDVVDRAVAEYNQLQADRLSGAA